MPDDPTPDHIIGPPPSPYELRHLARRRERSVVQADPVAEAKRLGDLAAEALMCADTLLQYLYKIRRNPEVRGHILMEMHEKGAEILLRELLEDIGSAECRPV